MTLADHHCLLDSAPPFIQTNPINSDNTLMSLKQVNSVAISVSDYLCFDHIARYQFYLQKIGTQQKSASWRALDVIGWISLSRIDRRQRGDRGRVV